MAILQRTVTSKGDIKQFTAVRIVTAIGHIHWLMSTKTLTAKANIIGIQTNPLKAKARLLPPLAYLNNVNGEIRTIRCKLEIKWDGITFTDESQYFVSAQGSSELSGMLGEGFASELDVEVDNTTKRFYPVTGTLAAYLKPRVPMRLSVDFGNTGNYVRMFTGYIKNYKPSTLSGLCNFHCFDNTQYILNKSFRGTTFEESSEEHGLYIEKRTDELIKILADAAGLVEGVGYDLDLGEETIPVAWFSDRYIWPLMSDIAVAERGRIFFDEKGILRFWNRSRLHDASTFNNLNLTRDNWLINVDFEIAEHAIKNRVIVQAKPRASAGIQVVWQNGDILSLNQYTDKLVYIPAAGSSGYQYAWIETDDPCTTWIQPVPYTDYEAHTTIFGGDPTYSSYDGFYDEDGDPDVNVTEYIKIATFNTYDNAVFIEVRNYYPKPIYFTKFQLRANPLRVWKYLQADYKDQASIDDYGEQKIEIKNDFISTEGMVDVMADTELTRWKNAKNNFKAPIMGIPYLRCGDVVNIEMLDASLEKYMINKLDWKIDEQGFKQDLDLVEPIHFPKIKGIAARGNLKKFAVSQTVNALAYISEEE